MEVLTAAQFLSGLLYAADFTRTLFRGIVNMTESSLYQSVLEQGREIGREQGREAGIRDAILALGESQFGKADDSVRQSLESIHNIQQLMSLLNRTRSAASWSELLNGSTGN